MKRCLVVDDEEVIRSLLLDFLRGKGYEAEAVPDGESALAFLAKNRIDFLLLDVRLPGISGVEVLQRSLEQYPGLPVIMISAYADERLARKALRMGAHDFFLKPFELEALEMRLSTKLALVDLERKADQSGRST